jgi:formate/nitrite transporter FocA (FNT family)
MIFELDACSPHQIAGKVETIAVAKARLPTFAVFMLAVFAGGFGAGVPPAGALGWPGLFYNLVPVRLGNIVGGVGLVAAVHFLIYRVALRERARNAPTASAVDAAALTQSPTDTPSR